MSFMADLTDQRRIRRRTNREFRPTVDPSSQGSASLEVRELLSGGVSLGVDAGPAAAQVHVPAAHRAKASHPPKRLTPAQAINAQYTAFLAAFNQQLNFYVESLSEQSTGSVNVSTALSAAYAPPSPLIEVNDASVFGPAGMFPTPIVATATLGAAPPLGQFTLNGSTGNTLTINVAQSSAISLPAGTILSASVPTSAQTSAATIFPSYIINSTTQLAISLVKYFNNIPIRLPKENAPPHTPVQRGAIQKFVYQSIASMLPTSLRELLLAVPLPTTPGADLNIYMASVNSAVALSHQTVTGGIQQIYAGKLLIPATSPANRLGETFNTGTSSSSSTSTSSSSNGSSSTGA
jgi:hypothetical protein